MLQLFAHLVLLLLLLAALPSVNGSTGNCCLCNNCEDIPKNKEDALIALSDDNDSATTSIVACSVLAFEVFGILNNEDEICRDIQKEHRDACCKEDSVVVPLDPAVLEEDAEEEGISSSNSRSLWQMARELWGWGATSSFSSTPSWQPPAPSYGLSAQRTTSFSTGNWGSSAYRTNNNPPAAPVYTPSNTNSGSFTSWAGRSSTNTAASTNNRGSSNSGSSSGPLTVLSNTANGCGVCYNGNLPRAPSCKGAHANMKDTASGKNFHFDGSCEYLDIKMKEEVGADGDCTSLRAFWNTYCGCENDYDPYTESCYTRQSVWTARGGY